MELLQSCANFDGLVQDCSISSALALELLQSYTKPSMWSVYPIPSGLLHWHGGNHTEIYGWILFVLVSWYSMFHWSLFFQSKAGGEAGPKPMIDNPNASAMKSSTLIKPLARKFTDTPDGLEPGELEFPFYTPVFGWDVLWYGAVRPSVRSSIHPVVIT